MFGLLFCQHFKELGGKVKDSVHGRQDQKGMLLVLGWIDAIAPIDSTWWMDEGFGGDLPRPTLSEAHGSRFRYLQAALGFASLAWSCPQ